jgi:hypothetical protein
MIDLWRCDAWDKRMCSVWDFTKTSLVRDGCTACIADCYRDSSVMLHFAVSLGDALNFWVNIPANRAAAGLQRTASRRLFQRRVLLG